MERRGRMESNGCLCPRCESALRPVLAKCYFWGNEPEPAFAVETLWRCAVCAEVYFTDEVDVLAPAA